MESITYDDALKYYYEFKQKYEKKYNTRKGKFINDKSMTKKQKRDYVKNIKMACISCKRPVGTTFEDKDRHLIAVCGDQQTPCKLNIKIKKADTMLTDNYIPYLLDEKQTLESDIIRLKLSFLFGFIDEDELTQVFDELKAKMSENNDLIDLTNGFITSSFDMEERKEQIRVLNVEKYNTVKEIKNMIREFITTRNNELVKDSVDMNIENLTEILQKLRVNKYREMYIETTNTDKGMIIHLIQNENSIHDKEYEVSEGEVLHYVI